MSEEAYTKSWLDAFATTLSGFWGHTIFIVLIAMAFWIGVRQRNPILAAILLFMAALVAYGAGLINFINMLKA